MQPVTLNAGREWADSLLPSPVVFESSTHTYTLKSTGLWVPGVTTIVGCMDKPFLVAWSASETAKYLDSRWPDVKACTTKAQFQSITRAAKTAHKRTADQAKDSGHIAHQWIEAHISLRLGVDGPGWPIFNKEAQNCVAAFLDWERQHTVEYLASELVVGSEPYQYGGKLDCIARVDGKVLLIDFKSSSRISPDYALQLAGYQICIQEAGGVIDGRMVLRLDKSGKGFEEHMITPSYDFDSEIFLSLRNIQRWKSAMEDSKPAWQSKRWQRQLSNL